MFERAYDTGAFSIRRSGVRFKYIVTFCVRVEYKIKTFDPFE